MDRITNPNTHRDLIEILQVKAIETFPELAMLFCSFTLSAVERDLVFETDGRTVFYSPDRLTEENRRDSEGLLRFFVHIHLHLLLETENFFRREDREKEKKKKILSDLKAAYAMSFLFRKKEDRRLLTVFRKNGFRADRLFSGEEAAFEWLDAHEELKALAEECTFDFHERITEDTEGRLPYDSRNARATSRTETKKETIRNLKESFLFHLSEADPGGMAKGQGNNGPFSEAADLTEEEEAARVDFGTFLRDFMTQGEEAILDTESFDYIPYCYGLEHYGNLPFLEPLEYKEVYRLDEVAIAIDTSGSCSGKLVSAFLEKTRDIMRQRENFFREFRLHLIQCDSTVEDYRIFHSVSEFDRAIENLEIKGHGNTDFRPVFELLEEQIRRKEIRRLKCLLYFTDGDGIYPLKKPDYPTAFVFLSEKTKKAKIPDWGICINLELPGF